MGEPEIREEGASPDSGEHPDLYILDASNAVEVRLLNDWLRSSTQISAVHGDTDRVAIPISSVKTTLGLESLSEKLTRSPDTLVTPVRVVWFPSSGGETRTPKLRDLFFGDARRPGAVRARHIANRHPDRYTCIAGEPATIRQLQARFSKRRGEEAHIAPGQFAAFVARQAGLTLDIAERRLHGRRYKVPKFVADSLANTAKFNKAIAELSTEQGKSEAELHKKAREYMEEMIAISHPFHIDTMGRFGKYISSLGYRDGIVYDPEAIERVQRITSERPSALLWTHKSHVDGFAMYTACYENDFPAPHILGGVNMAFAGLGYMARRAGAIFIRRSFQDNPLYKIVLRHYLSYLLEKRFPLSWSFEGTRSRVGKLMPPRYGLLKYVVDAARATGLEDIHFIPVSISYDLITDVSDYAAEQAGRTKQPESLKWFLAYMSSMRKPMGRIYMDFGEPVILHEAPSEEDDLALQKVAFEVGYQVNKITPLTLPSVFCMSLLGAAPQALTRQEILREMQLIVEWASERGIRMTSNLNIDHIGGIDAICDIMIEQGILARYDEGPETVYGIAHEQHLAASYYRNTIIHHFVNKAIIELALQKSSDSREGEGLHVFWAEAEHLRNLFKFEFFYSPTERFREEIRDELTRYSEDWETLVEGGRHVVHAFLDSMQPLVAHATLLNYVEAYTVVADVLCHVEAGEAIDEKSCMAKALTYGRQAYLQRRISSEASIAKLLFQNGYKLVEHLELTNRGGISLTERRKTFAQDLRKLSRRIDGIRTLVSANRNN